MEIGGVYIAIETLPLLLSLAAIVTGCLFARREIRNWLLLLGLLGLAVWLTIYYQTCGLPGSPQRAARSFLRAAKTGDCQAVFWYFSSDAKRTIEAQSRAWRVPPEFRYCRPGNILYTYEPSSVRIREHSADMVVVGVKKRQEGGYLLPGFWPTEFTYLDRELTLVKESGEWKIATVPARP